MQNTFTYLLLIKEMDEKHESLPQTVSDVNATLVQCRVHSRLLLTVGATVFQLKWHSDQINGNKT